jgi:hypothetical protein
MHHQHRKARTVACLGVFQHLPVAGGVAERDNRAPADHHMNAFWLACVIIIQKEPF